MNSEYEVIAKNDTRPRSVDVISGRMYLFLCDSPTSSPYLSSTIFTSFVVLSGFILISLTVAAVSDGVNLQLIEIQRQQKEEEEYEKDEELLESLLNAEVLDSERTIVSEARKKEIIKTWRSFARSGAGMFAKQKKISFTFSREESVHETNLRRMESLCENEDDEGEGDSVSVSNDKKRSLESQEPCPEGKQR